MHRRNSLRLFGYDYAQEGAYFITICTYKKMPIFGAVKNRDVELNQSGIIAKDQWLYLPEIFDHIVLDDFIIMPDHMHGIIIKTSGEIQTDLNEKKISHATSSISRIVGAFKTLSAKKINLIYNNPGNIIWQRSFYDRIIRNETELLSIRKYIQENPFQN